MSALYHYTEYTAFDGILNCGILRLNNLLNMNDASEMRFFIQEIEQVVSKRLEKENKSENALYLKNYINMELKNEFYYAAYAACFSKHRDDASQWDRYANRGAGVCIGFDEKKLRDLMGGAISLQPVFYKSKLKDESLVEELFQVAAKPIIDTHGLTDIMIRIWTKSAAYKHPSFASENEVRMIISPFVTDKFTVEPKYNIAKNRIKKYYPLDIKDLCKRNNTDLSELISEIIIGPTSTQSKAILEDYLSDCGLGQIAERITMSSCPLRSPSL